MENIAFAGFQSKQRASHYIQDQLRTSIQHHGDFNPIQKVWIHCLFFGRCLCHGIMRGGRAHTSWPFTGKITQGFGNEVTITGTADSIRDKALDNSDLPLAYFSYFVFQLGWIQWEISLTYCKWYQMICSPAKEHCTVLAPKNPRWMHEIWIIVSSFWNKLRNFPDINIKK